VDGKSAIWDRAEEFRKEHSELGTLPIDVLTVIEIRLKLDIIPFDRLLKKYSVDAAVVPDFSGIYVDKESYLCLETGRPRWLYNRFRFSLAHELGHIVLHRDLAADLRFSSLEDWWRWSRKYEATRFSLEQEANEFAGRLLVPADHLKSDFDEFVDAVKSRYPSWWTNANLRTAFTRRLSENYAVHADVIAIRLDREEIWQL
jgi:hypothetical protein